MVPDDCLLRTMASSTTTSSGPATKMDAAPLPLGDEEEEGGGPPQDHDSQNNKELHRSQPSPDNNSDTAPSNSLGGGQVDSVEDFKSASPSSVLLRIPLTKPYTNSENPDESKCVIVQNGPDKVSEHKQDDGSAVVRDDIALSLVESDGAISSRRASYIDVVGLSGDELTTTTTPVPTSVSASANGTVSPATVVSTDSSTATTAAGGAGGESSVATPPAGVFSAEDTEDKDMSEDEDKLVIHEGCGERRAEEEEDEEVIAIVKQEDSKEVAREGGAVMKVKQGVAMEDVKELKGEDLGRGELRDVF